ncbi:acyl-CoA thioesterase [Silvibacterium dinghuense]|uniref:Acyl-CoA thioesterase n=1 Tax=Silvibacterium dinghuense TaxID=1560006 RepID=A0A4Q1SE94_9BACT|nr:thioesterase family protein [Silvibacterium dinghuense]RXS95572.1 acyl-CoA thioesterase [Silvibacterium dinghuense]GGH14122.1 acyl-CoA thioester hydrolase [Silvibacterium dinghuense]
MASPTARATVRVRYAETDQMGVVYHANYFVWCEIGRVEFFRQLGHDYRSMELEDDCHLPVVEASCRYRTPARYDDEVVIETRVKLLRGPIVKFGYRLLRIGAENEVILAEAETTHICVDRNMQKRNLPSRYAEAMRETMTAQE